MTAAGVAFASKFERQTESGSAIVTVLKAHIMEPTKERK